ncbi:PIR protein, putative [Plasmodium sp.]|nr:PIR protein, putative [Plasmodium sp.]
MKLHYSKILLFCLPLNILVSPSYAHNKNKPYITTRHIPTNTSRVLSECDLYVSSYDNDPDMKSVKEIFDRQTSQRFDEYNERVKDKRQKCKEQCDKDIEEIIVKDKIQKSLGDKVEKVCLRCGFGLGGVAAGVGIFGAIAVNEVKKAALLAAAQKGIDAGIAKAIEELGKIVGLSDLSHIYWAAKINGTNFLEPNSLVTIVNEVNLMCDDIEAVKESYFCSATKSISEISSMLDVKTISPMAAKAAAEAGKAAKTTEDFEIALVNAESSHLYNAIGYSVLAILIILLVMVIIYLILRYRRKTKMNKKLQYTKLLNQ